MKLYQLCKEVVDDYVDYVEGFEVSTNKEYLEEVAYNLNLEEYFDNYFVRELNLKQEAYYYTEIRIHLKRKRIMFEPVLYHSLQKPMLEDRRDGGMLLKYTKQKEGETIAELKERAYKEALEEIKL